MESDCQRHLAAKLTVDRQVELAGKYTVEKLGMKAVQLSAVQGSEVGTVQCIALKFSTTQYCAVHCTAQYSTLYSTVQYTL